MKFLFSLYFIIIFYTPYKSSDTNVYICDNKTSEVYHIKKTCNALSHCKHEIITVTKEEAEKKLGKRGCKVCS